MCRGCCVTYKTGFWIGRLDLLTPYSHNSVLQAIQRYRCFTTYTSQFTAAHALRFSVFNSRILATDLSTSHCHFKSHNEVFFSQSNSFLSLFCNCQFRRLDAIQFLCSQAHILIGWRLETRLFTSLHTVLYC
jgi:hypothetical protein